MNDEEKKKVYLFYNELSNKKDLMFRYYVECSTTFDDVIFLMWHPMSLNLFLETFNID